MTHLASVGEGLGDKKTVEEQCDLQRQKAIAAGKTPQDWFSYIPRKTAKEMRHYAGRMSYPEKDSRLTTIVDIALQMWRKKMD